MKRIALAALLITLAAAAQKRPFWAFQAVIKPAVPATAPHPIDAFVRAKLEAKGLTHAPRADHRTLIRRLYFDLTGLPPRTEDLAQSYEATVEKLLASPEYGERWGRHWLDVVRFGETDGGEHNYERPHAWRYRDYVIQSFNSDKPYNQFIKEQIAGDILAPQDPNMVAATGFLVSGPWDQVQAEINKDKAMAMTQRMDELDDMVTTTFHTFQALTVNCARCHDHKFDPIPAKDYYQLTAVFAGVGFGNRAVISPEAKAAYDARIAPLKKQLDELRAKLTDLEEPARIKLLEPKFRAFDIARQSEPQRLPLNPYYNHNRFTPVAAKKFRLVINGQLGKAAPKLRWFRAGTFRLADWVGTAPATPAAPQIITFGNAVLKEIEWAGSIGVYELQATDDEQTWRTICSSLDHVGKVELTMPSLTEAEIDANVDSGARHALLDQRKKLEAELAAIPAPPLVYAARPRPEVDKSFLLDRGSVTKPVAEVKPAALSAVNQLPPSLHDGRDGDRRLALANWISDPRNPLTARVIVNRVWYHHFGTGLVNTPSDFGVMGDRPSHPELLDWLAAEFVEHGWSIKWLHRQILSSETYQQSSMLSEKAFAVDAGNRLLWRMPLKRMDAETLRDSVLFASGKLNLTQRGGPSFLLQKKGDSGSYIYKALDNDGPEVWRRAVYRFVVRGGERLMIDNFDCPDPAVATPQRNTSNTAVQALTLMNNEFVVRQAGILAERAGNVEALYQLLFQRQPSPRERELAAQFLKTESLAAYARVLINSNEFVYVP